MCGAVVCARCSCGVMWCVQVPRQPRTAQNARDRHRVCCEPQQRGGRTYSQPNVEQAQVPDWGFLRREHPAGACSRWAVDGGASARNTCTLAPNQLTVASSFHSMLTCSRFTVVPQARTTMPLSNHAESLLQWMLAPQHPTCRPVSGGQPKRHLVAATAPAVHSHTQPYTVSQPPSQPPSHPASHPATQPPSQPPSHPAIHGEATQPCTRAPDLTGRSDVMCTHPETSAMIFVASRTS